MLPDNDEQSAAESAGASDSAPHATPSTGTGAGRGDDPDAAPGNPYAAPGNPYAARDSAARSGFFGWVRGLGLVRENGWLGGVCGGVAARLGIDPIIVRGVVVVIALLGGPAFLFYAAAWALLPDTQDRIHLERMLRGVFDPASIAIVVMAILTFLPIAQGVWWAGGAFSFWGGAPGSIFKAIWSLIVIAGIVAFVVWAARGFPGSRWQRYGSPWPAGASEWTSAAATPEDAGTAGAAAATTAHMAGTAGAGVAGAPFTASAGTATGSPTAREGLNGSGDLDDWKQRQAAWRAERDAWRVQQNAERDAARARRAEEYRVASAQAAEREEARRLERLANPRAGARFTWATIGLALVAAALAGGVASADRSLHGYSLGIALAAATGVFGIASIVAGLMRRRGGFLGFLGFVMLILTLSAVFTPAVHIPGTGVYVDMSAVTSTIPSTVGSAVATVDHAIKELQ
jgi:phage shock protein PspC (stress-responsive transcriptional regulator)